MNYSMYKYRHLITIFTTAFITLGVLSLIYYISLPEQPQTLNGGFLTSEEAEGGSLIPSQYVLNTGINLEEIPPISDPVYMSVLAADSYLNDTSSGFVLFVDDRPQYYPIQILNYHYVVNDSDSLGGFSLTYCTFCESAVAYRTGRQLRASGYVYNNNMLLEDDEGNRWSQLTGLAVEGQAIGSTLARINQLESMTWDDFKERYPAGRVLSPNTGLSVEYGIHPFGAYPSNERVYYPVTFVREGIGRKEKIAGFEFEGRQIAIPLEHDEDYYFSEEFAAIYQRGRLVGINKTDVTSEIDLLVDSRYEPIPYIESFAMCWFGMYPDSELIEL